MLSNQYFQSLDLGDIHAKVMDGQRLSKEDGLALYSCPDPLAVGALAGHVRARLHGDKAYWVFNRHINYTNVCVNKCAFCAYHRDPGQEGGFELTVADAVDKIKALETKPREIHIVGGCHPDLPFEFYVDLISAVRENVAGATIKCFTAVEIAHFADVAGITWEEVLTRLKDAGLDMLPGGGAEIFAPEVRRRICPKKLSGEDWLRVHGLAHELGIQTNATMLYGHLESREDRLDHLLDIREQQDATGGFTCFIPLPFQTENSGLTGVSHGVDGLEELRTMSVTRLMLDNVPHLKAYWIMMTTKLAQTALHFGADDFDGTVIEEKIGHMAGARSEQGLTREDIEDMIRGCGFTPVQRDGRFNPVED